MGGKARVIFGTVLSFAALLASGGTLGPAIQAYWGYIAGASVLYGAWAARDARKRAEAAIGQSAEGRKTMLRGGAVAKYFVYGRQWVPSVVAGHREPQSKIDPYFWLVLALPVAHKIESIEQIWFGDEPITPLTADGSARVGAFNKEINHTAVATGNIPPNRIVTVLGQDVDQMDEITVTSISVAIRRPEPLITTGEGDWQDIVDPDAVGTLVAGTKNQIRIAGGSEGDRYTITYTYKLQRAYIKVWQYFGDDNQAANQPLIDATVGLPSTSIQKWTPSDQLNGVPYVVMRFHVDKDVFPNLLETISFQIQGKRNILDSRDGIERWTDNSALCIRDYALAECDVLPGEIDLARFHEQANYCDIVQNITLPTGESADEYNYRTNIALSTEAKPIDNLGLLLSTCDGSVSYSGMGCDIRVGKYEEPTLVLDDSDFAGPPEIIKSMPRMEIFNGVRARFQNSAKPFWPTEDAPAYVSAYYQSRQKVGELIREIDLQGTASAYMAHRICKQTLLRAMQGLRLKAIFKPKVLGLSPEMTVRLTCRALGMDEKVFRVKAIRPNGLHQYEVEFQEDAPELYQWDFNEAAGVDPAPNTTLPRIRDVPLIEGLGAYTNEKAMIVGPDGNIVPCCLVFWSPVTDQLVLGGGYVEVRHKRTQDADWTYSGPLAPTSTEFRFPIQRGDVILIEVRCANSLVAGEWTQIKRTTEDTPAPYLASGNDLLNAGFSFTGGPAANTYVFDGWTKYQSSGDGSNQSQAGSFYPLYDASGLNRDVGSVAIGPFGSATLGDLHWIQSDLMPVIAGTRRLFFVDLKPLFCEAFLNIHWYDANGQFFSAEASSAWIPAVSAEIADDQWPVARLFASVPTGVVAARVTLTMRVFSTTVSFLIVRRPFFGAAAKGQISLPPWNS